MNIIIVSTRLSKARNIQLAPRHLAMAAVFFVLSAFVLSFLFSWVGIRFNLPFASDLVSLVQEDRNRRNEEYLRDNVASMAVKLGEMQARVMRLDSLSERISKLSGISVPKSEVAGKGGADGQGGPLVKPSEPLVADELRLEIERLAGVVEQRNDELTVVESQLMERRIKSTLLPTLMPIEARYVGSTFGRRIDPIIGVTAMHEGLDFVADVGTKVHAAAGGIVMTAEMHPQYGNLIEIDHGNGFSSRYAHLANLAIKAGQIVKRGQLIAASGNTGRSTGPHLHFEVRYQGVAQNPERFLRQGSARGFVSRGETDSLSLVRRPTAKN